MNPPIESLQTATAAHEQQEAAVEVRQAFDRLPRESSKAYAAFRVYLDAGAERSLSMVARKLGKSKALMERWSRKTDWPGRVRAHEAYVAEVERQAIERVAVEKAVEWCKLTEPTRREAWIEADKTIAAVREARERWQESSRVPGFEAMARMLELAFKLKQFALGLTPELRGSDVTNVTAVKVDVSVALEKIYGMPLPVEVEGQLLRVEGPEAAPAAAGKEEAK